MVPMRCKIIVSSYMTRLWYGVSIAWLLSAQAKEGDEEKVTGTRAACINAASMALADAGIPMRDLVVSCAAGYLNSTPLLDLNYIEDSGGGPDLTVGIFPKLDKVSLLQMDSKLSTDLFEKVLTLAMEGSKAIAEYMRQMLLENTQKLAFARGTLKR
ncbi:hypothetical protein CY35_17G038100 [Sphagnum magellanicum]|nr:hypothetical protein CY35_17G038100 [Sphagnum magellanicum]